MCVSEGRVEKKNRGRHRGRGIRKRDGREKKVEFEDKRGKY